MDLIFSDIHADIEALDTILGLATNQDFTRKYGSFDRIINLGDLLERGNSPKQVLTKLKSLQKNYHVLSVMGNHDEAFLYKKPVTGSSIESLSAHKDLNEDELSFFVQNKDNTFGQQQLIDPKNNLLCVHGGPIDPTQIIPDNAPNDETWLYQKTWQRLSEEDFEFFSYSGYHYNTSSAFWETKKYLDDSIILCGHQHEEAVVVQNERPTNIISNLKITNERLSHFLVSKREIEIEKSNNYLIRIGLGGPSGYYGLGSPKSHFGIIQYNPKKVTLFTVK